MATRTPRAPRVAAEPSLTVVQAMARLQVGRTAIYDLIKSRKLASFHVGRLRRIRESALEAYIASQEAAE